MEIQTPAAATFSASLDAELFIFQLWFTYFPLFTENFLYYSIKGQILHYELLI